MHEGYLVLGGTEIANVARTASYLRVSGSSARIGPSACSCASFPDAVEDPPYIDPATDDAPWYDPGDDVSEGFSGLWVEKIDGLRDSPLDRSVTQRLGDGAVVSCPRLGSRTLTVSGWLVARDECSADYGLSWLNAALKGSECSDCTGNDLCLFTCCPSDAEDSDRQLRTLKGVSQSSGVAVLRKATPRRRTAGVCSTSGARPMYQVEFQLTTDPYFYRAPVEVVADQPWPIPTGEEDCNIVWRTDGACDPSKPGCTAGDNAPLAGCPPDPLCPPPPAPPRLPIATSNCACVPLHAVRTCVDVPALSVPSWFEAALQLDLYSGEAPLRNAVITVWANPLGKPADELDECAAIGTYYVSNVPALSTLRIDGTTNRSWMDCPGGVTTDASRNVYGDGGGPVQHIALSCGVPYTICLDADTQFVDPLATATVRLVTREE